jgi:3-deoxy-7-phosphoheptulonate synthase
MKKPIDDLRILETRPLIPPAILHEELPVTDSVAELIFKTRESISNLVHGSEKRLLAIIGPCSIHDPVGALVYAERLKVLADRVRDKILVVMRTYFEKPRTNVGWKGLINDPDLDESFNINKGLRLARRLLLDVNGLGLPTGSEFLDLQVPQHIADLTSWVAIGARTTESQVHRELASGLSMPVGFKNTTDGSLSQAVDAVKAARQSHWFPSVTKQAVGAVFHTAGNRDCHIILRGGTRTGPNYDAASVEKASELLARAELPSRVMIDCSHGNSDKDYRRQAGVLREIGSQLSNESKHILGFMLESNLVEGRQEIAPSTSLVYGQSITDGCISFEETERLLCEFASAL